MRIHTKLFLYVCAFSMGLGSLQAFAKGKPKISALEIFHSKKTLDPKKWRSFSVPKNTNNGFDHIIFSRNRSSDFVAFGFRSPGTLEKPKSIGCKGEIAKQQKESNTRAVTKLAAIKGWDCFFEIQKKNGQKQYGGIKSTVLKGKTLSAPFEFFFASQGNLREKELREVLSSVKVAGVQP